MDYLFDLLADFGAYPPGVAPTTARISEGAFFPGGAGLYGVRKGQPLPPLPVGGVMVLGHNFDSAASYERTLEHGGGDFSGPIWGSFITWLESCGIAPGRCFFTNAYVGLKADSRNPVGVFPGARDADFVRRCQAFLAEQIRLQQPRLILTLGKEAPRVLAPLASRLQDVWAGARNLSMLDNSGGALVYPVRFPGAPHDTAVVALTHPAFRHLNVGRRHFQRWSGDMAERELVVEGLQRCGGVS